MIRIERNQLDQNGEPIQPSEDWFRKAKRATARAIEKGAGHKISKLYRSGEVRMALEKLFHRKCAYCESRVGSVSPEEVEHYRPKGAVAERPDHPGYYWLAYTWVNLYPACTYCNQKRIDPPLWDEPTPGPTAGKGTSFPLEDETTRAMVPSDDVGRERPLLLDPCSQDMALEKRFRYDVTGQIHARDAEDRHAQGTIRLCHLNRVRLCQDRQKVIQRTRRYVRLLDLACSDPEMNPLVIAELQKLLDDQARDDAVHAGTSRFVVYDPAAFP